jgi:hypothetical protein
MEVFRYFNEPDNRFVESSVFEILRTVIHNYDVVFNFLGYISKYFNKFHNEYTLDNLYMFSQILHRKVTVLIIYKFGKTSMNAFS